jgi:hypothetical protein
MNRLVLFFCLFHASWAFADCATEIISGEQKMRGAQVASMLANEQSAVYQGLITINAAHGKICEAGSGTRSAVYLSGLRYKRALQAFDQAATDCSPPDAEAQADDEKAARAFQRILGDVRHYDEQLARDCDLQPVAKVLNTF